MSDEIKDLLNKYVSWLRDKTVVRQVGDYFEITTPYLDRHNDYLQIYAKKTEDAYLLSDDGYILKDLEQSGCKIETPKRIQLLKFALNGFGVEERGRVLQVKATTENFPHKKHNLVQAMLAINDMFYLAEPMVASLFYEDVISWLDLHEIRYVPNVKFTGKSGYDNKFDFAIPKSRKKPERILQTITKPDKNSAVALAFAWIDTQEVRPSGSIAFALLNDQEQSIPSEVTDALRNYEVTPVFWSRRESILSEFAA